MKYTTNHIPNLFQKLLEQKEMKICDFFNLEPIPQNIKSLDKSEKIIKNLRTKIQYSENTIKDALYSCEADYFSDTKNSIIDTKSNIEDLCSYVDELEEIVQKHEESYYSLEELLYEILNKENIDLSKYSSNITESELKSFNRIKTIKKLFQ